MIFAKFLIDLLSSIKIIGKKPLSDNVMVDDEGIVRQFSDGTIESVRWQELRKVTIQTTDQGPFFEDVFFILESENGGTIISHEWAVKIDLLTRLEKLPCFNHRAVINAMSCTDNEFFVAWEK